MPADERLAVGDGRQDDRLVAARRGARGLPGPDGPAGRPVEGGDDAVQRCDTGRVARAVEATRTRTAVQAAVAAPLRASTRRPPIPKPASRPHGLDVGALLRREG